MKTTDIDGDVQMGTAISLNRTIGELSEAIGLLFNDNPDDERGVERLTTRLKVALLNIQISHKTISSYLS